MAIDPGQRAQRALRVVRSTTVESLCEELAQRLSTRWDGDVDGLARIGPFDRVVVAVQGKGLERWMRRRLAQRLGVVGGIETPYLRRFMFEVAGLVTGEAPPSREGNDVLGLAYRVAQEIAERCGPDAGGSPSRDAHAAYPHDGVARVDAAHVRPLVTDPAAADAHPHALLAAGHRIAAIFDALEVERPELVVAWREGRPLPQRAPWLKGDAPDQARLAALCAWMHRLWWWTVGPGRTRGADGGCWSGHRAWQSVRDATAILRDDSAWHGAQERLRRHAAAGDRSGLPAMVSVCGVSSLPPLALEFLAALGRRVDVTLHLVVPTSRYMDESIMGRRDAAEPDDEHLDSLWSRGHRLLAVCGRQPMMMQQRLLAFDDIEDVEPIGAAGGAAGAAVGGDTSLQALQRSLRDGTPMDRDRAGDGSISVHMVSGATRAGEVLRDQVLDTFASLPGTGPDDVLVLTTDVERYGTAIARAFGAADPGPIPVTLADRSMRTERPAVRSFCDALRMADGELTLEALGAVVASVPVAERAGVSVEEAMRCIEALHDSGGRRFIDAEHRRRVLAAAGGPESVAAAHADAAASDAGDSACAGEVPDGTITDAADRLAMSMAMSPEIGGTQVPGMARVCATIDALVSLGRRTAEQRPMRDWCVWARDLLDAIVQRRTRSSDEGDLASQRAVVLDAIECVARAASDAGLEQPLPFAVARAEIIDAIDDGAVGRRFGAAGGVLVGGLVPMRSVPSRVVALVGLDRGAFPRRDERSGIDPRRWSRGAGDRSARDEDRALFLEAIHAAADRLIVISTAVDAASGEPEAASPLVDILVQQCGKAARFTRHGVHAFGEEEWADTPGIRPRRDWRARQCAVARRRGAQPDGPRRIVCAHIKSPVTVCDALLSRVASVDRIVECMRDPARWWLDAVGARLPSMEPDADGREPSTIDPVMRWSLEQELVQQAVRGVPVSIEGVMDAPRRSGALPWGAAADAVAHDLREWLAVDVMTSPGFAACPAVPEEWSIAGTGEPISARGWSSVSSEGTQVLFRGGAWRARHAVEIAIRAVAWAARGGTRTVIIPKPDARSRMPAEIGWTASAEDAVRTLHELRCIAAAGLVLPLCFHPMLLHGADVRALAAGEAGARDAIMRTLDEWLSRPSDDLSRGDTDARAMRAVLQGMSARDVLAAPGAHAVAPSRDVAVPQPGPSGSREVRTDFDGVWPAVDRLLASCGWAGSAAAGGVP